MNEAQLQATKAFLSAFGLPESTRIMYLKLTVDERPTNGVIYTVKTTLILPHPMPMFVTDRDEDS